MNAMIARMALISVAVLVIISMIIIISDRKTIISFIGKTA